MAVPFFSEKQVAAVVQNGLAGVNEIGIGAPQFGSAFTNQGLHLGFVYPLVTRCDDQHRHVIGFAPEDDAFSDLSQRNAQGIGRLLRRSCGVIQHDGDMGMALRLQQVSHPPYRLWQGLQFSTTHGLTRPLGQQGPGRQ